MVLCKAFVAEWTHLVIVKLSGSSFISYLSLSSVTFEVQFTSNHKHYGESTSLPSTHTLPRPSQVLMNSRYVFLEV